MLSFIVAGDTAAVIDALAWPLVAVLAGIFSLSRPGRQMLVRFSRTVRRVRAFGIDLELTTEGAAQVRADAEETFDSYRTTIRREYDRMVHIKNLRDLQMNLVENHLLALLPPDYRCTVHVPDILFEDAIYQLLDYYPTGSGRGRTFPVRFGIIGRAWRTGESEVEGDVPTEARELMRSWGMTVQEAAAAGRGRRSFLCCVLRQREMAVGLLYLDSEKRAAFGANTEAPDAAKLLELIEAKSEQLGLTTALVEIGTEMRKRGPAIRIFDEA